VKRRARLTVMADEYDALTPLAFAWQAHQGH
jgi:hypothetical protein